MDMFAISTIFSTDIQKRGALSTDTMGRCRWKLTNCSLVGFFHGTKNAIEGVSSRRTHSRM